MLETLVHLSQDDNDLPNSYRLMRIESPAVSSIVSLDVPKAASWQTNLSLTQSMGTAWLQSEQSAFARVPSAVVPRTWNYLLNPLHAEAASATVAEISEHLYDPRLLRRKGRST
jgi:RES domain-containing protein